MSASYERQSKGLIDHALRSRYIAALLAAGAITTGVVLAESRGSEPATRYDNRTEASLERTIKPAMMKAAGRIIKFSKEHPAITKVWFSNGNHDNVEVIVNSTEGQPESASQNSKIVLDTVIDQPAGSSARPNLNNVVSVSIYRSESKPGSFNNIRDEIDLRAPAGELESFIGQLNSHYEGWSAYEGGFYGPLEASRKLDSSNSDHFVAETSHTAPNPITTAEVVVGNIPKMLDRALDQLGQR